jgi:chromosome segregation ATPase
VPSILVSTLILRSITKSIQVYQLDVKAFGLESQRSMSGMQQQLQTMSENGEQQRSLTDQVIGQCAAKTALEERMHVAEVAVTESRQEIAVTQETKARLQQQITTLENEARILRDQTKDSTAILERLAEIDGQNKALKAQAEAFQDVSVDASRKLREKLEDYANMQLKLEEKESQLKETQDRSIAQAKEQAASIRHAFETHEEDKKHNRFQAKFERDAMDARHRIEVNDLKHKLTLADEHFAKQTEVLDQLRAGKHLADQAVSKQVAILAQFQNDKEDADAAAEEQSEQLEQAMADKETAQKLAIDRLGQLQKLAADLTHEVLVRVSFDVYQALILSSGVYRLHVQRFLVEARHSARGARMQDCEAQSVGESGY